MLTIDQYIANPCGTLSIPYWKNKNIQLPENMMIVHHSQFNLDDLQHYHDEPYFRLFHSLKNIGVNNLDDYYVKTASAEYINVIVDIINQSYTDLSVTKEQISFYTDTEVYDKDLWILVYDRKTELPVGCGIADFDCETKEGILEWIQVLPSYRGKKIGQLIVNELLHRLKNKASFVTVSGKVNNETNPEALYRKCGFEGDDIWHVMYAK